MKVKADPHLLRPLLHPEAAATKTHKQKRTKEIAAESRKALMEGAEAEVKAINEQVKMKTLLLASIKA